MRLYRFSKTKKDMWFHSMNHLVKRKVKHFLNREQLRSDIIIRNFFYVLITESLNIKTPNWWENNLHTIEDAQEDSISTSQSQSRSSLMRLIYFKHIFFEKFP